MSFFDFLEKIRNKPRHVRIQVLILCLFISMGIIISLWVVSLKSSFSTTQTASIGQDLMAPFGEMRKELPTLGRVIKDTISAFFEGDDAEQKGSEQEIEIDMKNLKPTEESKKENKPVELPLR